MGIDLNFQDENGELIEQVADLNGDFANFIGKFRDESFACLRFLDPYGDTVFNQSQLPVLLNELKGVQSQAGIAADVVASMIDLILRARGQVHTYLCFSGDWAV